MKRRYKGEGGDRESTSSKRARYSETEEEDDGEESEMDISAIEALLPSQIQTQDEKGEISGSGSKLANKEADAGIIDKVSLINFMCHRKLDVSLNPNVNFILGRNGSGKSAIMAGIVVGLGGTARNTERGSSLKQFIRSGETTAEIKINLRNRGKEAYRPEVFGECIIVERAIKRDGTGSYKVKNSKGKLVSDKKEELTHVLDHCNIQVDNPVSLLNQDTSRHFLQKSNPRDKYRLFMKATLLEQIATDYERAEEEQKRMKEGILHQSSLLPVYESSAKELEEKVETFKRLTGLEGKVDQLMKELQWAIVAEITEGIKPIEKDIGTAKQRIPRNENKKKQALEFVEKFNTKEKKVEKDLTEVAQEADNLTKEREKRATEKRSIEKQERNLSLNKLKVIKKQIEESINEKKCLETTRESCIVASQRDTAGEREQRLRLLEDSQKKLVMLEGDIDTAENDKRQFEAEVKRTEGQRDEIVQKMDRISDDIRGNERRLSQLNSSHSRGLATFGQDMQMLVDAIHQNSRRFSHPPIGPLGSKIKLKDYSWATAVEQVIKKSMLRAFVVDNHKDEEVLRRIINSVYKKGYKPEIICSPYQSTVYDVSRERPKCSYPTVLDMLEMCDPNIINVLIDQVNIEAVLLIDERRTAARVIVHDRPKGARSAYTKEGDQVLQHAHYSNKYGKLGIIQESVESAIREEEAQLDSLRGERDGLESIRRQVDQQVDRNRRSVVEAIRKVKRKVAEKRNLTMSIEELKNAEDEEEPEEDIATYDNEITEIDEKIKGLKEARREVEQELNGLKQKKLECSRKSADCEGRVEQVRARVLALQAEMGDCTHKKREAEQKVKFFRDRIDKFLEEVRKMESKISQLKKEAEQAIQKASEVCQPITTKRSRKSIQTEIDKLRRYIDRELPQLAEREEVEEQYLEAMGLYKKTVEAIEGEERALNALQESLELRRNKYCDLLERVSGRVKVFFTHFLRQRDYDGTIRFNHEKERLDITVKTDRHTNLSKSTKNPKALSGGERSFTTVCFIISLWEAIEAPFRCLDEFDVFMDMMNRRISMGLMLEHAKTQSNRQFIFFTPQDMSAMGIRTQDRDNRVKVLRLEAPERGQATLTFQQ